MKNNTINGVSVVICCYNSSKRIEKTLIALANQVFTIDVDWEVILIDNNSSDDIHQTATNIWNGLYTGIDFSIYKEPQAGLGFARKRGIDSAKYDYVLFCDDDNWLAANYVQGMYTIMNSDDAIAACGGKGIPFFETNPPNWFMEYAEAFATGSQEINKVDGKIINLYGAGMTINKNHFYQLEQTGFKSLLKDRTGNSLSSSGDTELTYAFVLMGLKLMYADDLRFYHFMPANRLTKEYLSKLFNAFGNDGPVRNLYYAYISNSKWHQSMKNWYYHLCLSIFRLIKYQIEPPKANARGIYFNWSVSYIKSLIRMKPMYKHIKINIESLQN